MRSEKNHYITEAKQILSRHEYQCIFSKDDAEIWRCKSPATNIYAFDIMISRFGVAIVGDIDNLTFNVRGDYGIGFLAGDDVEYYIHRKLDHNCKEFELDIQRLHGAAIEAICEKLIDGASNSDDESLPEFILDYCNNPPSYDQMLDYLRDTKDSADMDDEREKDIDDSIDLLLDVSDPISIDIAYDKLYNATGFHFDVGDIDLKKPTQGLLQGLYIINEAAKQIIEIKNKATAA